MTNTISPVTDKDYHIPGYGNEQPAPVAAELPVASPVREGDFNLGKDDLDPRNEEVSNAAYLTALTADVPQVDISSERAAVNTIYATAQPAAETAPTPASAEAHHTEAILRARAYTARVISMQDAALRNYGMEGPSLN